MAYKYTAETQPYKAPGKHTTIGSAPISYSGMPQVTINPFAYGQTAGKANAAGGTVPTVVIGGSSTVGTLPDAFNGNFSIGDDKNVSTPVTG